MNSVERVALQDAAHEADVVQQAGADQVHIVGRLDTLRQDPAAQDVAADGGHQHRMLEIVVERVALGDRLDRASR